MNNGKTLLVALFICIAAGSVIGLAAGIINEHFPSFLAQPYIVFPFDLVYGFFFLLSIITGLLFLKNSLTAKKNFRSQERVEDEVEIQIEISSFNMIQLSYIMVIISFIWLTASAAHFIGGDHESSYIVYNAVTALIVFCAAGFIQWDTMKFFNKKYPHKKISFFTTDMTMENHYEKLDEGEKFETYRVSFVVFRKMNIVFCTVVAALSVYGIYVSFHFIPILFAGVLWLVMNMIYFMEARKSYKMEKEVF